MQSRDYQRQRRTVQEAAGWGWGATEKEMVVGWGWGKAEVWGLVVEAERAEVAGWGLEAKGAVWGAA